MLSLLLTDSDRPLGLNLITQMSPVQQNLPSTDCLASATIGLSFNLFRKHSVDYTGSHTHTGSGTARHGAVTTPHGAVSGVKEPMPPEATVTYRKVSPRLPIIAIN